jgi:hypothetical protein
MELRLNNLLNYNPWLTTHRKRKMQRKNAWTMGLLNWEEAA